MTIRSGSEGALGFSDALKPAEENLAKAAGVVHDLANVLTVVLGSLEHLRRQPLDDRGFQHLDRAEWAVRKAVRLARQTLDEVRPGCDVDSRVVDVNEAVRAFAVVMDQSADGRPQLSVELASGPLSARLDAEGLQLALLNLVRNAQDATVDGGEITLRTAGQEKDGLGNRPTVEIAVSDTGIGMPPEAVRHATEAFFTTKAPGRGAGLGLWRVQCFAEDAGGKVEIETAPGRGTTVRLVLPRSQSQSPETPRNRA